jgi:hypothetical protein
MSLAHEAPLRGYHPAIGGSAGDGTHGGTFVERPEKMPTKAECSHVVETKDELLDAITTDNATIYIDANIDVTGVEGQWTGDNITLVGQFCDPNVPGRGNVIHSDEPSKYVFKSAYGHAPTLWGVSFEGPEKSYIDPDHTADDFSETFASAFFCYDTKGVFQIYGCEFFGWTLAGILAGAKNYTTTTDVDRSSFHHCQMEHLGYGIEHYNGFLSINRCFFDKCRHAVSSFGYENGGYAIANSVIGPGPWCGHALDMHCLANNVSWGDRTAGEFVRVYRCTIMSTWDRGGYDQEGIAIRGEPVKTSYVDKTHFYHPHEPDPTGGQGDAYRQETGWHDPPDEWLNFEPRDNIFGEQQPAKRLATYGAPRAPRQGNTMKKLTIIGKGGSGAGGGSYELSINASKVRRLDSTEPNDGIEKAGDGWYTISGGIVTATDTFEVSDDVVIDSAWITTPAVVELDGEQVELAPRMAAEIDARFESVDDRITQLKQWAQGKFESAHIGFVFGDEK